EIIQNATAEIDRGDKIALIGANGKGKSTLLRIIAGTEPFSGERIPGHNVEQSFYAQHQLEALHANNTVLEEMQGCGSQKNELELRILLGCFLFSGDDVEKKIKVLSGGEKARVALAKTIVSKANFLLLDEPTNHLDMHSCELLVEALNKYEGSFILVSHDRYFISKTANKIWEIDDLQIREFKGGYEEWVDWKTRKEDGLKLAAENNKPAKNQAAKPLKQNAVNKQQQTVNAPIDKMQKKELQKQQRLFQELEEKLAQLREKKDQLESALAHPDTYSDKSNFVKTEADYKEVNEELLRVNQQYESQFEKIVSLEAKQ
ncbi:MAG TPA: ATP-binding cassette domain-containing protein, partial [Puia sp.]|nr:ATP-binding cassette domain-containing protein [Puia sp.]